MNAVESPRAAGRLARMFARIRRDFGPVEVSKLTEPDYDGAAAQVMAAVAAHTALRRSPLTGRDQISIDSAHGDLLDAIIEPITRAWQYEAHRAHDRIVGELCERKNRETAQIARLAPRLDQIRDDADHAAAAYKAMWQALASTQVVDPSRQQVPRPVPRPITDEADELALLRNDSGGHAETTSSVDTGERVKSGEGLDVLWGGGQPIPAPATRTAAPNPGSSTPPVPPVPVGVAGHNGAPIHHQK